MVSPCERVGAAELKACQCTQRAIHGDAAVV